MLIVVHERTAEGTPILLPSETVAFTVPAVTMVFGDADPVGVGSLFVTTEYVRGGFRGVMVFLAHFSV